MALTRAIFPCLSMQLISRDNGQIQIHIGQDDASAARRDAFAAGASRRCRPADLVCDPGLKNGGYTVDNDESAAVELVGPPCPCPCLAQTEAVQLTRTHNAGPRH